MKRIVKGTSWQLYLFFGLLLIGLCVFLFLASQKEDIATPKVLYEGYVAEQEFNRILVVTAEVWEKNKDLPNVNWGEEDPQCIWFTFPEKHVDVKRGNEVTVTFNGVVQESLPGKANADKITVRKEQN
ncbi:DUF3221 domain-containing protein [Paenisporosarcina cavernae]|uniref:DUF3221 domain-containing protein n=1 Tax=Paenisporosarcina cavernae TaxID=2320858 RepID=A0A385YPC8_9BACL|nr:DUF3221 domain-containing protein [Paenisporosarcina cavernae]AYC28559.1 DUF3221 domain-containing protein [Paenisporosarcina cavernae]